MSYDNFACSDNWGWPGWPWVGAILLVRKGRKLGLQSEVMWERSRTLTRRGESHSLKIENIWKVCFSATQMCTNWPHHITRPSEWDRVSVRGREAKSHMKGDWEYISHSGAAILNHQNCLHLKVRFPFVAYCHLLSALLFFYDKK